MAGHEVGLDELSSGVDALFLVDQADECADGGSDGCVESDPFVLGGRLLLCSLNVVPFETLRCADGGCF